MLRVMGMIALVAVVCGCAGVAGRRQRSIDHKQTIEFEKGGHHKYHAVNIDSEQIARTITVTFDSDAPLAVFLVNEQQYLPALEAIYKSERPTQSLASTKDVKAGAISATLPAKASATVIFTDINPPRRLQMHIHD